MGNKRGVQVQLALARLRAGTRGWRCGACRPRWATWSEAMQTLCGPQRAALVRGRIDKTIVIDTLLPPIRALFVGRAPGRADAAAGGGGDRAHETTTGGTTLVFTNVRSQAEIWYQLLLAARPRLGRAGRAAPRLARPGCASGWRPA
jgi:ATP-dependent Lhr-like helicase